MQIQKLNAPGSVDNATPLACSRRVSISLQYGFIGLMSPASRFAMFSSHFLASAVHSWHSALLVWHVSLGERPSTPGAKDSVLVPQPANSKTANAVGNFTLAWQLTLTLPSQLPLKQFALG